MAEKYGADQFRIVAIKRRNHTIIPRGNDELQYGDLIFVVTRPAFISEVFALCGKEPFEIRNIVIVGASRIGIKAASLLEKNYNVKIIEKDREKCIQLADRLKSTLVINGDGRDLNLLREEGIRNIDAFISLIRVTDVGYRFINGCCDSMDFVYAIPVSSTPLLRPYLPDRRGLCC